MTELNDLKNYHKNPRQMTEKRFNLLSESLKEFGDLSGVVRNIKTVEVVGGNQRTNFFKQDPDNVEIMISERFNKPTKTGTVALGHIIYDGEKFSYREVDWDLKKEERANIIANKVSGDWDFDTLANAFDIDLLLESGWDKFELGFLEKDLDYSFQNKEINPEDINKVSEQFKQKSCPNCGYEF